MSEAVEKKAEKYFNDGRVSLLAAKKLSISFQVEGTSSYVVTFGGGLWQCTCPSRVLECAHVVASQLWVQDKLKSGTDTLLESFKKPSFNPS